MLAVAISPGLHAQGDDTRYVSDKLTITVRSGPSGSHQILRTISSGTPVQVLEAGTDGYARIRTPRGVEGWALDRFLVSEPIARDRLAESEKLLEELTQANHRLRVENEELNQNRAGAEQQLGQRDMESQRLQEELSRLQDLAARPAELESNNQALREQLTAVNRENKLLEESLRGLREQTERVWFITGAGVLLAGIIC
ncbi:MAG: TIGR04211 family SH3 domain-containing protein, partial [Gammaproteobacteria bacterium]